MSSAVEVERSCINVCMVTLVSEKTIFRVNHYQNLLLEINSFPTIKSILSLVLTKCRLQRTR